MLIYKSEFKRYPYKGKFFVVERIEPPSLIDPPIINEIILYEGECDIQQSGAMSSPMLLKAGYAIYFPLPKDEHGNYILKIQKGATFDGIMCGQRVNGEVLGIFSSELGGVVAYVQDIDIE